MNNLNLSVDIITTDDEFLAKWNAIGQTLKQLNPGECRVSVSTGLGGARAAKPNPVNGMLPPQMPSFHPLNPSS